MARRFFSAVLLARLCCLIAVLGSAFLLMVGLVQTGFAQATPPLSFGNNYFVTGDYVVAGVGLRGLGVNGFATKQFTMPDANSVPATGVPPGVDIVAALLYWETVESSQTTLAGQKGFFRPVFPGGPATGYPITGAVLGNPNAPVSWSSGGCSGSSQGSKTMRTYSADVRPYLPQDSKGNILANGTYEVSLADSGSNGGGAPLTLGASLIIIYRALSSSLPLTSVVIYDGAFAPANGSSTMSQTLQGFYEAASSPISKLTHIVGNGQSNKYETVSLNGINLPSLYGSLPPFPGFYNGSWDNPTWSFPSANYLNDTNPIKAGDASATTMVTPNSSNGGCVSWGVVVVGTTVENSDNDGLLDVWKQNSGYCDASVNNGVCSKTDPSWVSLAGATLGEKDLFVEIDYMCSIVNADATCDTTNGYSFYPSSNALSMMENAFSPHGVSIHFVPGNAGYPAAIATGAIQEQTCTDTTDASGNPVLCPYNETMINGVPTPTAPPGVVGWKAGFEFLKNQPLNYPDETSCEQALNGPCIRRFQHGRKDSYHYAVLAHAVGVPEWGLEDGSLTSVVASGNTVTFTTSAPHGLIAGTDRVTIADAITTSSLNGTYVVQSASGNVFTIQSPTATNSSYSVLTDPNLSVSSGRVDSISGFSDIGGADSLIALGLWGSAGQTDPVKAGTFMHELGHSNGLTHGGFYFDTQNSYVPTPEPNCKPNYQSVMNYQFQVDLLDNGALDYSEQQLNPLNETSLPPGLTTMDGSALAYSIARWYTPNAPAGVGTAATHHCDGTSISHTDPNPKMFRVEGTADPIAPAWVNDSDVNFDGTLSTSLRGYNDWANLDLRQIGATGSDILGGAGGHFGLGTGGHFGLGTGGHFGLGTGGHFGLGTGTAHGEMSFTTANSFVRPPRNLTAAQTPPSHYIQLNWVAPTFGQIGSYNIYRSTNGANAVQIGSVSSLTFNDTNVTCGATYSYFVTAVLANTNPPQESVPSNTTSAISSCAPTSTTVTSSADPSIFGQSVTFTATVTNIGTNTATPTGSVQFSIDGARFGAPVPISGSGSVATGTGGATASLTLSGSPHTIEAVYTNTDGNFIGSSGTASQAVKSAPTSTTVTSSTNPSTIGRSITFTATVSNTAGAVISTATPTGSIQFIDGSSLLGTPQTLSGLGTATLTTSTLGVGNHPITAVYTNVDGNFMGSISTISTSIAQVVQDFSISATPSAQTISSGHQAIYNISVTPISGLTGTIALSCSGAPANSTCSVSPSTENLQGAAVMSTVTLSASKNVDHGAFTLTFTGALVAGNLSHTTSVQLTVK